MKILLSLSKYHFDPVFDEQPIIGGHSMGVLAKLFYDVACELGEVDYIDSREIVSGKSYDLLISLPKNFGELTRRNHFKKTICYLNIAESSYIDDVLHREANKLGCEVSDCYTPRNYYHADHYFMLGGEFLRQQYIKAGIPTEKITDINYGMDDIPFKPRDRNKKPVFIHLATTMGLRKGFYYAYKDFLKATEEGLDADLHCVGRVQKEKFWIDLAKEADANPRITVHGWINCSDPRYKEIIYASDFHVFPSWAEGQGGTIMEAVSGGCVPIVSKESGFPHFPIGEYVRGNTWIWHKAAALPNEDFRRIQLEMQELLKTKYNNQIFKQIVKETINGLA